ncbi:hypothetical protein ABK040_014050 [Willaertia magna]
MNRILCAASKHAKTCLNCRKVSPSSSLMMLNNNSKRFLKTKVAASTINHSFAKSVQPNVKEIMVTFKVIDGEGHSHNVEAIIGEPLMYALQRAGIEGIKPDPSCLGQCACSGCHVIVAQEYEHSLPQCSEDEAEILHDGAFVHENSRLSCQIIVEKQYEGMVLAVPPRTDDESFDPHFRF